MVVVVWFIGDWFVVVFVFVGCVVLVGYWLFRLWYFFVVDGSDLCVVWFGNGLFVVGVDIRVGYWW